MLISIKPHITCDFPGGGGGGGGGGPHPLSPPSGFAYESLYRYLDQARRNIICFSADNIRLATCILLSSG